MNKRTALFNRVPVKNVNRNMFDLSHEVKMSGKFGKLYPVLLMDALPSDTIRDQMTAFCRFAPMLSPVMHRIDIITHFFFVPNRIICDFWEEFITGGQDGTSAPVLPFIRPLDFTGDPDNTSLLQKGTLWDYLGLPVNEGEDCRSEQKFSVLPFRAYAKVWNDYYRDPNLDDELDLDVSLQGNVSAQTIAAGLMSLRNKGWERDYYTSMLPWAQRGSEVLMPLAGSGPVTNSSPLVITPNAGNPGNLTTDSLGFVGVDGNVLGVDTLSGLTAELTTSEVSINDLRRSLAIQSWLENNARGGGRYIEQLQAHFNQIVPDFRLQRAEYLGGGRQAVQISEVLATAAGEQASLGGSSSYLGELGGHGISMGKSNRFTYRCQEHGWVIGITSVLPRTAYQQGIDRMWTRETKFDFPWPELAHLGEQEMYSKEVFYSFDSDNDAANNLPFGYLPRYAEMKFKNDRVAGDFRDQLLFWHLGRKFTQRPVLDSDFTTMLEDGRNAAGQELEETFRRIFAVESDVDYLWFQFFHHLTAKRPLPYFGVPQLLG